MKNSQHHIIQFVCIMTMLASIMLQGFTHVVKMKPLYNNTNLPVAFSEEKMPLNGETCHGEYQTYLAKIAWQNTGFREFFNRCYKQVAFSCFNMTDNENVVKGKNKELYLLGNLRDITGELLGLSYASIEEAKADARNNVEASLTLIDTLKSHGTSFLFVFCPTKPVVYPEYLPDSYKDSFIDFSLADFYINLFKENNIPHIDFYNHFKTIKDTVSYPLYTRTGAHWAESTMSFVSDSILRKLEEVSGYKLPKVSPVTPWFTRHYSDQDGELEPSLNLLFPLPKPKLPRNGFALTDTLGADRPKLLVVGDGYFVPLLHSNFVEAFERWDYWMYNRDSYSSRPYYYGKRLNTLFDAAEILEDADIVLVVYTSNYLFHFMNGFTTSALELLQKGVTSDQEAVEIIMENIKNNAEWYKLIEQQAADKGISVEENLYLNALYVLQTEKAKKNN